MKHFLSYTEDPHTDRRDLRNLRRLLPYVWAYRGRVMVALTCLLLAKGATVAVPLVLKEIVDTLDASDARNLALPLGLLLGYGALRLASTGFNELRDALYARVRYGAMRHISHQVLQHLHALSLRFHLERRTGGISRNLERGATSVSSVMNYLVFNILPTAAEFLLVAGILIGQFDPFFAVTVLLTAVIYVAFTLVLTEWRMRFRHAMNRLDSQANSQAVDGLLNYETVKYFNNEHLETNRYERTLSEWEDTAVRTQTSMSLLNFGQGAIIALGVTVIMVLAARGVTSGSMTIGDLVMVNALMLQLFMPLNLLGTVYRQLKYALADMDLMFKVLDQEPEIRDRADAPELAVDEARVRFERVGFGYHAERPVLFDLDFEVPPGAKVAVVGPSGAGKSTIARLLFRFYDVDAGRILIDGQDIREVTQQSVRRAIGIVPQDTVLFNESIYFNLAYANPNADRDEIERAAAMAQIHDFIQSLPEGYDTVVGERGLKLSGGEKQRVAIARAILKDPRILVFDEATSSLDTHTERAIQETLAKVAADRTTLAIAHRLSTIADADEILVMDQGRIIERGTHADLLAAEGTYAHMWRLQQEERKEEALLEAAGAEGAPLGKTAAGDG